MPDPRAKSLADLDAYAALLGEARSIKGVSLWQDAWRRLRKNLVAMISLCTITTIGLLALFTPLLPLQSPRHMKKENIWQFHPPTMQPLFAPTLGILDAEGKRTPGPTEDRLIEDKFGALNFFDRFLVDVRLNVFGDRCLPSLCGTDDLGRDVLARLFWGARVSLVVGLVATLVSLVIGVSFGAISGYAGGWLDNAMMRFVDVMYSIPFMFVVIFLITILNADEIKEWLREHNVDRIKIFYLVIGAIFWLTMARVVRGQILSLKHEQFIEAARVMGASQVRIIFRHLVPNVLSIIIVYLTLTIPSVMLFESFLSFLGLGVEPPDVSWGLLAKDGVEVITPVKIYWWLVLFPGLALGVTLFALNFLGDGLRDALDPRMKNR